MASRRFVFPATWFCYVLVSRYPLIVPFSPGVSMPAMMRSSILAAFILVGPAAVAAEAPRLTERTIAVSGDAVIRTAPDQVIIRVAVESGGTDLARILADTDTRTGKVKAVAREAGVNPEHIQTESITLQHRYVKDQPEGYTAQRQVVVCVKNMAKVNDLLAKLVGAGITRIDSVSFETSEMRKRRDEARVQAVHSAQQKAELLAKELGVKVGAPITVTEGGTGLTGGSRGGYQSFVPESGGDEGEGGFAPGQIAITAQVSVVFAIQ